MTYFCSEETLYTPLAKGENNNEEQEKPVVVHDWRDYPALRSSKKLDGTRPPDNSVLVKTGGNALQAIDREALEQKHVVAVTVPWNASPGQTILVLVPTTGDGGGLLHDPNNNDNNNNDDTRMVTVQIPKGAQPGHVFLVKVPEPVVVTGIPVDFSVTTKTTGTTIVPSQEVMAAAPSLATSSSSSSSSSPDDLVLEEEFEMVHNEEHGGAEEASQEHRSIV